MKVVTFKNLVTALFFTGLAAGGASARVVEDITGHQAIEEGNGILSGRFYSVDALGNPMNWPDGSQEKVILTVSGPSAQILHFQMNSSVYGRYFRRDGSFLKSLPAGEYTIKSWQYLAPLPGVDIVLAEGSVNIPFTVRNGQVTYIGSFCLDWVKHLEKDTVEVKSDWDNAKELIAFKLGADFKEQYFVSFQVNQPDSILASLPEAPGLISLK